MDRVRVFRGKWADPEHEPTLVAVPPDRGRRDCRPGSGQLAPSQAADALRRWQRFLETYIYPDREPRRGFAEFPPVHFEHLTAALDDGS